MDRTTTSSSTTATVAASQNPQLGVNKLGGSICKATLPPAPQQPQPAAKRLSLPPAPRPPRQHYSVPRPADQFYHVSENQFRDFVQQLTVSTPSKPDQVYHVSENQFRDFVQQHTAGTPSPPPPQHNNHHLAHRPPLPLQSLPKTPPTRLQRICPPPISRPSPVHPNHHAVPPNPNHNNPVFHRPLPPQPQPQPQHMPATDPAWADSPVATAAAANSLSSATPPGAAAAAPAAPAAVAGQAPHPHPQPSHPHPQPPPPPQLPSPGILPSPSGFLNLLWSTPMTPYPLLSPEFQHPPPLTPNFPALSPLPGTGILGPRPMPPPSPGLWFPQSPSGLLSPSGFLPILSPRWRDM